jgi:hypothetical protein
LAWDIQAAPVALYNNFSCSPGGKVLAFIVRHHHTHNFFGILLFAFAEVKAAVG